MASSRKLPLFVFPEELIYDQDTNKQVLTIYNPFEVPLKYKILCTTPRKYRVMNSQGILKSQCCIDIVIVHLQQERGGKGDFEDETTPNEDVDKFCVELYQGSKLLGQKQVVSKFLPHRKKHNSVMNSEFKELPVRTRSNEQRQLPIRTTGHGTPSWLTIVVGVFSLLLLLLPLDGESSSWPPWLHVTVTMKLIASFVLGLVTMAILKL